MPLVIMKCYGTVLFCCTSALSVYAQIWKTRSWGHQKGGGCHLIGRAVESVFSIPLDMVLCILVQKTPRAKGHHHHLYSNQYWQRSPPLFQDSLLVIEKYKSGFLPPADFPFEDLSTTDGSSSNISQTGLGVNKQTNKHLWWCVQCTYT